LEFNQAVRLQPPMEGHNQQSTRLLKVIKQSDPKLWKRRFHAFALYSRLVIKQLVYNDETDLKYLKEIEKDVNEPWLFRIQAANCAQFIYRGQRDEERAVKKMLKMMEMCNKALAESDDEYLTSTVTYNVNSNDPLDMIQREIRDVILQIRTDVKACLLRMQGTWETYIWEGKPRGNNSDLSNQLGEAAKAVKALFLPSLSCAGCGITKVTNSNDVAPFKLKLCSKCKRFAYCSKDCQTLHWKEQGHKELCRDLGEFKPGDFVEVFGLVGRKDLNGSIAKVLKVVTKEDGVVRFVVEACLSSRPYQINVKPANLRMVLSVEEGERL
ncbi:hypothetical protein HDU76_007153, partial [Blyttiomyces sp. JEL0837]